MQAAPAVYSVAQLTAMIKDRIVSDLRLAHCSVTGEISNFKKHSSGHLYLTLKDDQSRIRAVMFAGKARSLKFRPEDGMRVIVTGQVNVFERDGAYQLYVDSMQPDGVGALYAAFTQLKEKLEREGLFDRARKRQVPQFPVCIGVVTSPTGAVIRDIVSTLRRRYPLAKVLLHPARVQGPGAAETIVEGIRALAAWSRPDRAIDVIIVARGGGSLEELWPFNEEVVARAIVASPIPIISAVGHETDFTIADFAADVRAATPTAAAELAAPNQIELTARLTALQRSATVALRQELKQSRDWLAAVEVNQILMQPQRIIDMQRQNVDYIESKLHQALTRPLRKAGNDVGRLAERLYRVDIGIRLARARARLEGVERTVQAQLDTRVSRAGAALDRLIASLEALNPLGVLKRGYSVVYGADGKQIIQSVKTAVQQSTLWLRLSDGTLAVQPVYKQRRGEGTRHDRTEQSRLDL